MYWNVEKGNNAPKWIESHIEAQEIQASWITQTACMGFNISRESGEQMDNWTPMEKTPLWICVNITDITVAKSEASKFFDRG